MKGNLKIGIATILVLLMSMVSMGFASAQTIVINETDSQPYYADGSEYNMSVSVLDEAGSVNDTFSGNVTLSFNTSNAWVSDDGTPPWNSTTNVSATNGTASFFVAAFDSNDNVTANLTATTNPSNYTIIDFWAPEETAYISGEYRDTGGSPIEEADVTWDEDTTINVAGVYNKTITSGSTGVYRAVKATTSDVIIDEKLDTTSGAGYTVTVPVGAEYKVYGYAYTYEATAATINVTDSTTYPANLVFASARVPTTIDLSYEDGTDSKTNYADGTETNAEKLVISVYDQFGELVEDDVQVTVDGVGDLNNQNPDTNPDGTVNTLETITCTDGECSLWITALGADSNTLTGPIETVNITATSNTNSTANDTATKDYVLRGNTSVSGWVTYKNEDTGAEGPASGATVWAAYRGMSNHSLSYVQSTFPWMVDDTVDAHGHYVLDGIAVGENQREIYDLFSYHASDTEVIIYSTYEGYNGVNDTTDTPSLAAQGELDASVVRGGVTGMFIAAADIQPLYFWQDGDTVAHNLKLNDIEPIDYSINITEDKHTLVYNDETNVYVKVEQYPETDPSQATGVGNVPVNVSIVGDSSDCTLANDTAEGKYVWATTNESGVANVTFNSAETNSDNVTIKATYDTETDDQEVISTTDSKRVVEISQISLDVTDEQGEHIALLPGQGRIVVALWMDNTTSADGSFDPSNDWLVKAEMGADVDNNRQAYTPQLNATAVFNELYPDTQQQQEVPGVFLKPYNPRYSASDGHSSYNNVITGYDYHVQAIAVSPDVSDASELNETNYKTGYAILLDKPSGTSTADVFIDVPDAWTTGEEEGTVTKADILDEINAYMEDPTPEGKSKILEMIAELMG